MTSHLGRIVSLKCIHLLERQKSYYLTNLSRTYLQVKSMSRPIFAGHGILISGLNLIMGVHFRCMI